MVYQCIVTKSRNQLITWIHLKPDKNLTSTNEYKYVGLSINEKGNLLAQGKDVRGGNERVQGGYGLHQRSWNGIFMSDVNFVRETLDASRE